MSVTKGLYQTAEIVIWSELKVFVDEMSYMIKNDNLSSEEKETLWEKEKIPVTSVFKLPLSKELFGFKSY